MDESSLAILRASCLRLAGEGRLKAALAFGPGAFGYGGRDEVAVMAIVGRLRPGVRCLRDRTSGAFFILVDSGLFEKDARRGVMGDLLADKLLVPYIPVHGADHLEELEVAFKRRLAWELLLGLALSLPEFATEMYIDPRYFLYETVLRMARIMPSSAYMFANLFSKPGDRRANEPRTMRGFLEALRSLEEAGYVGRDGPFIRPTGKLLRKKPRPHVLMDLAHRLGGALRGMSKHLLKVLPGIMRPYSMEKEAFMRRFGRRAGPLRSLPSPQSFLLLRTHIGLRPALAGVALDEIARLVGPVGPGDDVRVSEIGGSLNVVYLVSVVGEEGQVRFVVKHFKNWNNLKWLSLRLWSFGAKRFIISGRERLKREYTMCRRLGELGFSVPKVFHVDLTNNSLVEEFIEGGNLATGSKTSSSAIWGAKCPE